MLRRTFISSLITSLYTASLKASTMKSVMNSKIRLLRHATLVIEINNLKILVDPMLSPKDGMDPVQNCGNDIRIPMVGLPINKTELDKLLNEVDAVIVTHLHRDHWDVAAQNLIHKSKTIFCQPGDSVKLTEQGFKNVLPIQSNLSWKGITIHRTPGQHGTGDIGKKMGEVSGFIFESGQNSIYVAGDTIWCNEVEETLTNFNPEVIVVNAGGAKFLSGDPITMTRQDVLAVNKKRPTAKMIAVHMDTVNHCFAKRTDLKIVVVDNNLSKHILIPEDGEVIMI